MIRTFNSRTASLLAAVVLVALSLYSGVLTAQHGHPIVGTWSGFMERPSGQPLRALYIFDFSAEQVISGALIVNGRRYPITRAELDPDTWTVEMEAQGQDRGGEMRSYHLSAAFENLDSPTQRALAGRWREGDSGGDFRVVIN